MSGGVHSPKPGNSVSVGVVVGSGSGALSPLSLSQRGEGRESTVETSIRNLANALPLREDEDAMLVRERPKRNRSGSWSVGDFVAGFGVSKPALSPPRHLPPSATPRGGGALPPSSLGSTRRVASSGSRPSSPPPPPPPQAIPSLRPSPKTLESNRRRSVAVAAAAVGASRNRQHHHHHQQQHAQQEPSRLLKDNNSKASSQRGIFRADGETGSRDGGRRIMPRRKSSSLRRLSREEKKEEESSSAGIESQGEVESLYHNNHHDLTVVAPPPPPPEKVLLPMERLSRWHRTNTESSSELIMMGGSDMDDEFYYFNTSPEPHHYATTGLASATATDGGLASLASNSLPRPVPLSSMSDRLSSSATQDDLFGGPPLRGPPPSSTHAQHAPMSVDSFDFSVDTMTPTSAAGGRYSTASFFPGPNNSNTGITPAHTISPQGSADGFPLQHAPSSSSMMEISTRGGRGWGDFSERALTGSGSQQQLQQEQQYQQYQPYHPSHVVKGGIPKLRVFGRDVPPAASKRLYRCWEVCRRGPSWNRISSSVVRHAPCFWWCCSSNKFDATNATDRAILLRLNILCGIFALVQITVGVFLAIVTFTSRSGDGEVGERVERERNSSTQDDFSRQTFLTFNLWFLSGMLYLIATLAVILLLTSLLTQRVIRDVNLIGALRYLWALYWILPAETFLVIGLFDYHRVTDVWVKHWWATGQMSWFRSWLCPDGTAESKCLVPVDGGTNFTSEVDWCRAFYNGDEDCASIRDEAQLLMTTNAYVFYTGNAIWGLLLVILLLLALGMLEGIITSPIVQSSKEANIPAWLTLPFMGCLAGGYTLLFAPATVLGPQSHANILWIGITYMVSAGMFAFAAGLAWYISSTFSVLESGRDKRRKLWAIHIFIVMLILTIFSVAAIMVASLVYSVDLVQVDAGGFNDADRGSVACLVDTAHSCTNCDEHDKDTPQCPEWSKDDVVKVLQTQLKQSATLAAIFLIYTFSALKYGFTLRHHLSMYQIDYV